MPSRLPLAEAISDPSFCPRKSDVPELLALLGQADEAMAKAAERALAHLGVEVALALAERMPTAEPPLRERLCMLVGRVARAHGDDHLRALLLAWLEDPDARTRRQACRALGKLCSEASTPPPGVEEGLLAAWSSERALAERRAIAEALGKAGSERALGVLSHASIADPELGRIRDEAVARIERSLGRAAPCQIDAAAQAPGPTAVLLHVRAGLELMLADELGPSFEPRVIGAGRVGATLRGPMARLFAARTALRFTFPLAPLELGPDEDRAARVAQALCSPEAIRLLRAFTKGAIRYRIEWKEAGHQRAASYRVAALVSAHEPSLVNDPVASVWQVNVVERPQRGQRRVYLDLWPRALDDPRFEYRHKDVPAASHPTIAAALARAGGAEASDVVWDPFMGSGTELVERAKLGPYLRLHGSDLEQRALNAARTNLTAAGVARFDLERGDATEHVPARSITLIITNPPMGRRVLDPSALPRLLDAFISHAALLLAPGGRLVWMSPLGAHSIQVAAEAGLELDHRREIDMGGFRAELQLFVKRA